MPRIHRLCSLLLLASEAVLGGCATHAGLQTTTAAPGAAATPQTLKSLQTQARKKPDDVALQEQYYLQREQAQTRWLLQAQQALSEGRLDAAQSDLHKVLEVDPHSPMATALLARLQRAQARQDALQQAQGDLNTGLPAEARHFLQQILAQNPADAQAQQLMVKARDAQRKLDLAHALNANSVDASGYPPNLDVLWQGVPDLSRPDHRKIYFLRRLPRDPFYPDQSAPPDQTWGTRCYASPPDDPQPGADVYDIHSLSPQTGLNGVPYRDW